MDFARIFGEAHRAIPASAGLHLRALTLDIEDLFDALGAMLDQWDPNGGLRSESAAERDNHQSAIRGSVSEAEIRGFGVYDRSMLTLSRTLILPGGVERTVAIGVGDASVRVHSIGRPSKDIDLSSQSSSDEMFVADFLLRHGRPRPTWGRMRFLLPLVPMPLIIIGFGGVLATSALNGYAQLLLITIVALVLVGLGIWSWNLAKRYSYLRSRFYVRGQSRRETYAERANRRADLKIAVITAPLTILVTLVGAWLTGFLEI